jgi:hypothetical protein
VDRFQGGAGIFSFTHRGQIVSGAHPTFCQIDTGVFFPEIKQPGRDADQSLPSSAEVKSGKGVPVL